MTERISEIDDEPVVGKVYLGPGVQSYGQWMPVIGPLHEDTAIIGFADKHYHKDVRFMRGRDIQDRFDWAVTVSLNLPTCTPEVLTLTTVLTDIDGPLREIRKVCRRAMPELPLQISDEGRPAWQLKLEDAYENASARCGRCPHRGFSLKGLPVKDGKVICPGHGLQWEVETGKIVRRTK